jgi:hypothetical protein
VLKQTHTTKVDEIMVRRSAALLLSSCLAVLCSCDDDHRRHAVLVVVVFGLPTAIVPSFVRGCRSSPVLILRCDCCERQVKEAMLRIRRAALKNIKNEHTGYRASIRQLTKVWLASTI